MKTLKKFGEQLKKTTLFQSDPIGSVMSFSQKAFTKQTLQLLNENLNSISRTKTCNIQKLNY